MSAVALGPKLARFELAQPYAPWRELFGSVLPKHALEAYDLDDVFLSDAASSPPRRRSSIPRPAPP